MTHDRDDMLTLYGVPGVGAIMYMRLMERFKAASAVFDAADNDLMQVPGMRPSVVAALREFDRDAFLADQHKRMESCDASYIIAGDDDYPSLLSEHRTRPPFLFVRGDRRALSAKSIAIVGTRRASGYGIGMTRELVAGAVAAGYCIVSGMAAGIDSVAHTAALEHGGMTVAVFGCGVDVIFPAQNRGLARKITGSGCLVSQFPMGMEPLRGHFPARNDVVVGLSAAAVVVEAGTKSGALITADLAIRAGRPLFAVPGDARSDKSRGANALFAKGALPATDAASIITHLGGKASAAHTAARPSLPLPEGLQGEIVRTLVDGPRHIEEIAAQLESPVHILLNELTILELSGHVRERPGKMFERIC